MYPYTKGVYMKIILFIISAFVLFGIGGYVGYTTRPSSPPVSVEESVTPTQTEKSIRTVQGVLIKIPDPKDDYTHTIKTIDELISVASMTVKLDDYSGKKVEAVGQYSGTTLFIDSIMEIQ